MDLITLTIWCAENPRTAASRILELEKQIKQPTLKEDNHETRRPESRDAGAEN